MLDRFPGWESRTGIWQVGDIDLVFAAVALGIIDSKIDRVGRAIPTPQWDARRASHGLGRRREKSF